MSFVTQYDVDLVHSIEELIGHQIAAFEMPEEEVLKGISKVFASKRAAMLRAVEEEGRDKTSAGQRTKKRQQRTDRDGKAAGKQQA